MSEQSFLLDIVDTAISNGINFKLLHQKSHQGCAGFFDEKNLLCCTNMPRVKWLSLLSHESCHMDQFLEKEPLYLKFSLPHIARNRQKRYRAIMEMERNCEERSIQKIINYGLPIYLEDYYREANCYLASHFYFAKYNCFYKVSKSPYENKELMANLPDDRLLSTRELWRPNRKIGSFLKLHNKPN